MNTRTKIPLIGIMAMLAVIAWSGTAWSQSVYTDYYTPRFYMDSLVLYDETGAPIYYDGDLAYAVPDDYSEYDQLVNHFLDNEDAYFQWFEDVGYANLEYRRTPVLDYYKPRYYHGYLVFYVGNQPIYYVDGVRHSISPSDRRYARLMRHFNQHRAEYGRWYRSVGRSYRWYRRPVFTDYYRPQYFNGYLVFYDVSGLPYYYRNSRTVFIPRNHHHYHTYISHYRHHRHNYHKWYKAKGRRHHEYRRPKSYRKRVIAPKAPKAKRGRADRKPYRHRRHKPTINPKRQPTHHSQPRIEPKQHGHRDRPKRPDRHERIDKPKRPDRHDRHDRADKPKRPDRHDRADKPKRPDRHDRADKPKPRDRNKKKKDHKRDKRKGKDRNKRKVKPPRSGR